MKRLPIISTIVVVIAMAVMIGLGVWQLQRARWKNALVADYAAAPSLPPITLSPVPDPRHVPLFRRASAICLEPVSWRAVAGRNVQGQSGWSHLAACRTGAEGPGLTVDIGWSKDAKPPAWNGGPVSGIVASDRETIYRIVATVPAPGLKASAPPSMDSIPNNHFAYAVQWFVFAGIAGVIYLLALRKRS